MSNQIKFLILYGVSGALIWMFILPSYNGSGYNILNRIPLSQKMDDQTKSKDLIKKAEDLLKNGQDFNNQFKNFKDENKRKLLTAVPIGLDGLRLLNEVIIFSDKTGMDMTVIPEGTSNTNNKGKSYTPTGLTVQFVKIDYDSLYKYLDKLQHNLRILNTKALNMSLDKENKLSGAISFDAFYFNNQPILSGISAIVQTDGNGETKDTAKTATTTTTGSAGSNELDTIINSQTFREVDAISGLSKLLGGKIQINPILNDLNDSTVLVDRQKVTQRSNPFINKN